MHIDSIDFDIVIVIMALTCWKLSEPMHVITDFSQQTCIDMSTNNTSYFYWRNNSNNLPYCRIYEKKGYSGNDCPCPPGYVCQKSCNGTDIHCKTDKDCGGQPCMGTCSTTNKPLCMVYHANTIDYENTFYSAQIFKPTCTTSGEWEAKQCKGGLNGRCFCFDASGNRLYGEAKYRDAKNMTCACSRKKADLLTSGNKYISFHCDSKGNFEELQCHNALCWCVESESGKLLAPMVPEKVMTKLPCYRGKDIGRQYLRQCESVAYANAYIENILKKHGVIYTDLGDKKCDGDGAYGIYNLSGSIARCTWRDGQQIGSWQSDATTDISHLNCNCARDYKMYNHQLTCEGTGNYRPLQTVVTASKSKFFCVDIDGFPKTRLSSVKVDCASYY